MSLTSEDMKDLDDICDNSDDQLFWLLVIGVGVVMGMGYWCS